MLARLNGHAGGKQLDDEALDELEGEALVIIEHSDRYSHQTVEMARKTLEMILRLRRPGEQRSESGHPIFQVILGDRPIDLDEELLVANA
jgi:hypothetical protein